jgi:hypothetical protein
MASVQRRQRIATKIERAYPLGVSFMLDGDAHAQAIRPETSPETANVKSREQTDDKGRLSLSPSVAAVCACELAGLSGPAIDFVQLTHQIDPSFSR